MKKYRNENKELCRVHGADRRARQRKAVLKLELKNEFRIIYKKAKEYEDITGIKFNVDHIIPIKNKNVCGLHVPWNLQILTFDQNMKKGNKFDGTYDNNGWKSN